MTFNNWILAKHANDLPLQRLYERRFSPEFKIAFDAWLKTHPETNPNAPPGPTWMPEYDNHLLDQGQRIDDEATGVFTEGSDDRAIAEDYVRNSLLLAMVLVLIAMAQRFRVRQVRIAVLIVASVLIAFVLATVVRYPRL